MSRLITIWRIVLLCIYASISSGQIFISELADPLNNFESNRYIEIYNPAACDIDLTGWELQAIGNNSVCHTWSLSGTIEPGEALTVGGTNASIPIDFQDASWNRTTTNCNFGWNGQYRDGAQLKNDDGTITDFVKIDSLEDKYYFRNSVLTRNQNITEPTNIFSLTNWTRTTTDDAGTGASTPGSHIGFIDTLLVPKLINNGSLTCSKPTTILTVSEGVEYNFNSSFTPISTSTVSTPDTYTVTVMDNNGCTSTSFTTVSEDKALPVVETVDTINLCFRDSIEWLSTTFDDIGGSSPTFAVWDASFSDTLTDIYSVTTDEIVKFIATNESTNGCKDTVDIIIDVVQVPSISLSAAPFCATNGSITLPITVSGTLNSTVNINDGTTNYIANTGSTGSDSFNYTFLGSPSLRITSISSEGCVFMGCSP